MTENGFNPKWGNINSSNDGSTMMVCLMSVRLPHGSPTMSVRLMTKTPNVGISPSLTDRLQEGETCIG